MSNSGKLSSRQFEKFKLLIKEKLGVNLNDTKMEMVQARLHKLMRKARISCYDDYFKSVIEPGSHLWTDFVDAMTTHKTHFFREDAHFNFLTNRMEFILNECPDIEQGKELKIWSSACSTGDEPYTIGMVLKEILPSGINIRILGTDVSPGVLQKAEKAEYILGEEDNISPYYLSKYFTKMGEKVVVNREIRNLVTYRTFNLLNPFPFQGKFHIIFCRNVMIYFDFKTQEQLIKKFYDALAPGGLLFIGHSESLTQKQYKFKYVQPTIYKKPE